MLPLPDVEGSGPPVPLAAKKPRRSDPALLSKVSEAHRKHCDFHRSAHIPSFTNAHASEQDIHVYRRCEEAHQGLFQAHQRHHKIGLPVPYLVNDEISLSFQVRRLHTQTRCYGAVMFASIDSIAIGHTKSYFTPNLTASEGAQGVLEDCSQELGNLMSQQWLLSQVDHSLRVDRWRSDAAESAADQ